MHLPNAWSNFISSQSLTSNAPFSVGLRPGHSSRNQPNQLAQQRQQKFRLDRFAFFDRSSFCWKAISPFLSEVELWKF
ncbi:hypothetical protein UNPA324_08865 [Bradyrhizobium sp. UNPA324]|nr:hypothetical protein UNPA324_08865 [Bradyrhizobium sp. UNPA324]